jgi:hypothetical protein
MLYLPILSIRKETDWRVANSPPFRCLDQNQFFLRWMSIPNFFFYLPPQTIVVID